MKDGGMLMNDELRGEMLISTDLAVLVLDPQLEFWIRIE